MTADELNTFVADFLYTEFPRCSLKAAREKGCFWLTVTAELIGLIRHSVPSHEPAVLDFLGKAHSGGLLLTFDSDIGHETPRAELINSQHPLTRTVGRFYENPDRTHLVAKLRVRSKEMDISRWRNMTMFLIGGGSNLRDLPKLLAVSPRPTLVTPPKILPLSLPEGIACNGMDAKKDCVARYGKLLFVAYALCFPYHLLSQYTTPGSVESLKPPEPPIRPDWDIDPLGLGA